MKSFLIGLIVVLSLGAQAGDMPEVRGAKWIAVAEGVEKNAAVAQFVKEFDLKAGVQRATLYASGLGVYEVRVNGLRPGDENEILRPGFTTWNKTRQVEAFDVTEAVKAGKNRVRVCAAVSNSWWGDECVDVKGNVSGFLCVLEVEYEDGVRERFVTDETWCAGWEGPYKVASIFEGEDYDAREASGWEGKIKSAAVEYKGEHGAALEKMGRGSFRRVDLAFRPKAGYAWNLDDVREANEAQFGVVVKKAIEVKGNQAIVVEPGEEVVIDFGQNAAAHPEFVAQAEKAGAKLTINCSEMLNDGKGEKARNCDGPAGSRFGRSYACARSEINYTFAGTGKEAYRPVYTFFGYRYLHLRADAKVTIWELRSVPVTSVVKEWERGKIETGREDINRLIKNCEWGMYSNYLSVPTDCPQRSERQGWTGDAQVFVKAAMFTADVTEFMCKWMRDMRDMQDERGAYGVTAPHGKFDTAGSCHEGATRAGQFGWADAGIIVPYQVWKLGGDVRILEQNWESMQRYMGYMNRKAKAWPLDVTWEYGDWLSFEKLESCKACTIGGGAKWKGTSEYRKWWSFLNDAYHLWDVQMMGEMAAALGKEEEAAGYRAQGAAVLARMRERHLDKDGRLFAGVRDMQCANLFALKTGIFTSEERKREACEALRRSFAAHGGCLQTGFLGTSILLDALVESGEVKMAYDLLFNRKTPGWLAEVENGATTVWETWNAYSKEAGFRADGMLSFNHYANGAVLGWLYEKAAGIGAPKDGTLEDGCVLAPHPDRRLGRVAAEVRVGKGVVKSEWKYEEDGAWVWKFEVPKGMKAKVIVPGEEAKEYGAGVYTIRRELPRPLIPFVAVTGKPADADVERKVQELYEKSFQQFLIYPRTGLEYEYMGEEWLHLTEVFCREAEKRGMKVWLYDEYNWPSGTCKGRVPRENEAWRYAELAVYRDEATGAFTWKKLWGPEDWGNLCEEEGVKRFIELTHDKYQKRLGKYLKNKTIVGMFTDEPGTKGRVETEGQPWRFRWFSTMEGDYRARTGREFRKDVEACMSGKVAVQGYLEDYAAVYGAKFRKAYFDQLRAKCDEMGIWLTGHLLYEQNPFWAIVHNGNPLEVLKGESLPGIDEIPTRLDPTPGKKMEWVTFATAQHAVSRNGNGGAVELFAYGPNDMRGAVMREMIWVCAFQGIDHYLLSLDVMDMRGLVKGGEAESYAAWLAPCQMGQAWTERAGVLNEEAARAARFARKSVELDVGVRYPQRLASYQEMDLDGVLRGFESAQVTVDLLAEDEKSKLPYVFVMGADNRSLYEEVTKTRFANVAEAVKWVQGRVKKSVRLLEADGKVAGNVLSHVYEDGSAAFINLDLGGARRLVLEREGVRTVVELAPREVLAFEKGDVVEGVKERKCAAVGVKEFDVAFSQGAVVRINFGADGVGKIRVREDLKGVKFAVLSYWKVAASVEMDGKKIAAERACGILPEGYNELYRETEEMDLAAGEHVFRIVSGKGDHNYFLPVMMMVGDVAAKGGEVWARGKRVAMGSLKELGLGASMGKMVYAAEVEVPEGAVGLRLETGGLFTEVKWNGVSLGTRAWAPFEWELPKSAAGKGRLEITIYLPMVNMCGDENAKGVKWDSRFIVPPRSVEAQGLVGADWVCE